MNSRKFDLDKFFSAVVGAMVRGKLQPHCFSAHVVGRGYVNRGEAEFDRADYLAQLKRAAEHEISNMGFASEYAELGYDRPARGILFANWNRLPKKLDSILEKLGFAAEWSDEWQVCDCGRAYRTSADSYVWAPAYKTVNGEEMCLKCAADSE